MVVVKRLCNKGHNAYSSRARWLLIEEAVLALLLPTGLYFMISRCWPEVLLNKTIILGYMLIYILIALCSMWKLAVAILSFTITSAYMVPHDRNLIRRCRPLYRIFFLRKDKCSPDGWVVVTHGCGVKKSKLYLFKL